MHDETVHPVPASRPASGGDAEPSDSEGPRPDRWRILAVTLLVGFMSLLDVTIVNVAVPSIQDGLSARPSTVQWVVSGYALAFGLTLVAGGRLGDAYGRRRLMLVGLSGFVLSSAAAGLAPNAELLIVARLLQGASAGLLTPQSSGLIQQLFSGAERGKAFGYFGLTVSIASAVGPLLGGLVIGAAGPDIGWRLLFLVNVPIGAAALIAIARMVPGRDHDARREHIDATGALLLGAAVLFLLFPVVSIEAGARLPLLLLPLAPLTAWAFVAWERRVIDRGRAPLLDLALLRRLPGYANGLAVGTLYFTSFTGVFLAASVWLQTSRDVTALQTGLILTPFAVGSAITSPIAGRLVSRIGRPLTAWALAVTMASLGCAAIVGPAAASDDLWWTLSPFLLLAGMGGGAVVAPNFTLTLAEVPPAMGGAAGGALQTGQRIGSALGAALLMTVYQVAASAVDGDTGFRLALAAAIVIMSTALVAALVAVRTARRAVPAGPPTSS